MMRNLAALGALAIAVGLWLVLAWPAAEPEQVEPGAVEAAAPVAPAPPPSAADPAAAPLPGAVAEPPATAVETNPQPTAAATTVESSDPIQGDQGPVEEYRKRFESEPRDSVASDWEKHIRGAFRASSAAPDLFKSVLCRETICKIELNWSKDRQRPYMHAITRLGIGGAHGHAEAGKHSFAMPLALSPVGAADADGVRLVELYVRRKPPTD